MEGNESEYHPEYIHPSNKGKQDLFGEWMDRIEHLDAYVTDKPIDIEIDIEGTNYVDEDLIVLMLRGEGTHWEPLAIVEAITELKNWVWEGAAHPMEDSVEKIKTVEPITPAKKIKTVELITPAKTLFLPLLSLFFLVLLFLLSLFVIVFL